ncbi:Fic family protein [Agromyces aerolatus]|uniref:Fic family protein n=1 Tax=Agromyces sp. LY-1074 TaxID=3074080 RepID=UPI0028589D53|nr:MULTISPECIES: Fic family protein [unclassified Agromyces]MDR5699177.1 Fic family protein [Agromyces sp. LY-1074]MDR5705472.1 Fic family protein [Agromyces sp. LY-1358]
MSEASPVSSWPSIAQESLEWRSRHLGASARDDREEVSGTRTYQAAVPPDIRGLEPKPSSAVAALAASAENALVRFDAGFGEQMVGFAPLLLRSEAAASSQIEHLTASARAILTAELADAMGERVSQRNANEIVGNTKAMRSALALAADLDVASVLEMHRVLMAGSNHTPGAFRTEPVWIGTNGRTPIGAEFVAPSFERVPALMDDVMAFARRNDLPILIQTAIAHAQFETIHPFTDGNGRTGRALVQAMLRNKDVTRAVVVPVSAGLLADVSAYHAALTSYRAGDVDPIVEQVALAVEDAIANATQLLGELGALHERWLAELTPRSGSQLDAVIRYASRQPVFTAAVAARDLGIGVTNIYPHLRRLVERGILKPKNEHKLGQVWRAPQVLQALDRFAERAGRRG